LQISGVRFTLTYPRKLCLFRVLLGGPATVTSLPFCKDTGEGGTTPVFSSWLVYLQIAWEVPLPPLQWDPPHNIVTSLLSKVAGWVPPLLPSLAGLFFYSSVRGCPLSFSAQGTPPSLLHVFLLLFFIIQFFFSFFPEWGSVCPGGYAGLAQGYLWEYCVLLSSPGGLLLLSQ
jgi:hypothetical protein